MQKLADLRTYLIEHPIKIDADNLLTFAEKGRVNYSHDPDNRSFAVSYDANIIVTDFVTDFNSLIFVLLDWLHEHQTDLSDEPLDFHVDILDHHRADISFLVKLSDDVSVTAVEGGDDLILLSEPDIHKKGMPGSDPVVVPE